MSWDREGLVLEGKPHSLIRVDKEAILPSVRRFSDQVVVYCCRDGRRERKEERGKDKRGYQSQSSCTCLYEVKFPQNVTFESLPHQSGEEGK